MIRLYISLATAILALPLKAATCPKGELAFTQTTLPLLEKECGICHKNNSSYTQYLFDDTSLSYEAVMNYVNFQDTPNSKLVEQSGNNHCGIKKCQSHAEQTTQLINSWWNEGQSSCSQNIEFQSDSISSIELEYNELVELEWDLSKINADLEGASISLLAERLETSAGNYAYRFVSPSIISEDVSLHIAGLKILINGSYNPFEDSFLKIEGTFGGLENNTPVLAASSLVVAGESNSDTISLGFTSLSAIEKQECPDTKSFSDQIMPLLETCTTCHDSNLPDTNNNFLAGQSFDLKQSTPDEQCIKTLQRISTNSINHSVLFKYPAHGFLGHEIALTPKEKKSIITWAKSQ